MSPSLPMSQRQNRNWKLEHGVLRGLAEAQKYAGRASYQPRITEHDWACWAGLSVLHRVVRAKGFVWKSGTTDKRRGGMPQLDTLVPMNYRPLPNLDLSRSIILARREAFDRVFRQPHFWLMRDLYRFAIGGAYLEATGTMPSGKAIREMAARLSKKQAVAIPGLGDLTYRAVGVIITRHRVGSAHRRDVGRGYILEWWKISAAMHAIDVRRGLADDVDDSDDSTIAPRPDGLWNDGDEQP